MTMDPLEAVFIFCFVFGLAVSTLSFALGSLHIGGDHGAGGGGHADAHGGHTGDGDGADHGGDEGPSPINLNTITAFLAFFGGIGYLLYGQLRVAAAIALGGAVVAGLAGGALIFWFVARVLVRHQGILDPADFQLEGCVATVSRSIRGDGIGEVVYEKDGTRRSEGARSATGQAIEAGTEVVIIKYERGLAYVEPWKSYVGGPE